MFPGLSKSMGCTLYSVRFQTESAPWGGALFRMPGPFENASRNDDVMRTLRDFVAAH